MMDKDVIEAPGLPIAGNVLSLLREPIGFLQGLRDLGDAVRIKVGPLPIYVLNDPDLIHSVLVTHGDDFARGRFFEKLSLVVGNGLATSSGEFHKKQRRMVAPAFRHERLRTYASIMVTETRTMLDSWQPGGQLELFHELFELGADIATKTFLGTDLDPCTAETFRTSATVLLDGFIRRVVTPGEMLDKIPTPSNRRFQRARRELRRIVIELVKKQVASGTEDNTLLSFLVVARDEEGQPMSHQQLFDEVVTMLLAAAETQTTTMSWLFYELARHPEIERRVRAELSEVLGGREPSFADIPLLPYLRDVINETLRLHHPIWNLMRRSVRAVDLPGLSLPANAEVLFSPVTLHRDARHFPRPNEFDPDRWADRKPDRTTFIPFAAGGHNCIGDHFALTQMSLVIASVVAEWRLELAPGSHLRETLSGTLRPNKMPMILHRIS